MNTDQATDTKLSGKNTLNKKVNQYVYRDIYWFIVQPYHRAIIFVLILPLKHPVVLLYEFYS